MNNRLIKSNDAGGGGCTNTVDLYNPFPDGGGVALYQLNGDATDVSGNYDGTWVGTPAYGTGEFGQAATFNGSNQGISLPSVNLGSSFTISCWYKYDGNDTNYNSTIVGSSDENPSIIHNKISSTNNISYDTSGSGIEILSNVITNTWYHIVVTQDGTQVNTYVNGSFSSNGTVTALTATIEGIGYDPNQTRWLSGAVDQVRFFSRALRPYEVEALYTEEYCTPTIVPSEHFNTVTYTGTSNPRSITGVGFQPDLVWIKSRTNIPFPINHTLSDSVRGANSILRSNLTAAEVIASTEITSFDPDGFSLGTGASVNYSSDDLVAWNFKAGGAAVTNTDGTITSQVSANTEAGFSIVKWTGNGVNNATVGHGLGSTPVITIRKRLDSAVFWGVVYNNTLTSNIGSPTNYLILNDTAAEQQAAQLQQNDSVFYTTNTYDSLLNSEWIAYCFAEVEGFSSIGSYVGTGAAGNPIVTGFEPAFVMVKRSSSTGNWVMYDNKRDLENPRTRVLYADDPYQELPTPDVSLNILENGFEINGTSTGVNASGSTYIYMAFAADPTTVEPTLEDSFNTVTYTGNGGTQTIGGVFEGGGSFNGSSSKITTVSSQLPIPASGAFTVSFWAKNDDWMGSNQYNRCMLSFGDFWLKSEYQTGRFGLGDPNTGYETTSSMGLGWNHCVLTVDASDNINLYLNGANEFTGNKSISRTNGGNFAIGVARLSNPVYYYYGLLDQVRIFNTALTAEQVTELYEETEADSHTLNFPSGAGAVALYELNGNANDTGGTYNGTASNVSWLHNGVGFQPDLVWIKARNNSYTHMLQDSVRGNYRFLTSAVTNAENTNSNRDWFKSFDSNGFTVSYLSSDSTPTTEWNNSGEPYVAWCWKGAELPAINSNGSIPSVVSANPAAGFSIVSYTGNGVASTVGHGLSEAPKVIIAKNRNDGAEAWPVYHSDLGKDKVLTLNTTDASYTLSNFWGTNGIDDTVFGITSSAFESINQNGSGFIAYCFAEVAGFSKFGSYTGTGSAGNLVVTGFEPAFLMAKRSDGVGNWFLLDNKRGTNPNGRTLFANASDSEQNYDVYGVNFVSNGFSFTGPYFNDNNATFIYMAFANQF